VVAVEISPVGIVVDYASAPLQTRGYADIVQRAGAEAFVEVGVRDGVLVGGKEGGGSDEFVL
jgi:hypothetical protein